MTGKEDFDDFDDEFDTDESEVDESPRGGKTINWRRIERVKEKMWLKEQLSDFNDWA